MGTPSRTRRMATGAHPLVQTPKGSLAGKAAGFHSLVESRRWHEVALPQLSIYSHRRPLLLSSRQGVRSLRLEGSFGCTCCIALEHARSSQFPLLYLSGRIGTASCISDKQGVC